MGKKYIPLDEALNPPLTFRTNSKRDAELIMNVLETVMDYIKSITPVEIPEEKKPVTKRRKKTQ